MSKPRFDHRIKRPHGPWVPAAATDVSRTFARIRKERAAQEVAEKENRLISILRKRSG